MESHQQQIMVVSTKLDALQQMVEDLNLKLTALVLENNHSEKQMDVRQDQISRPFSLTSPDMSHKDVLVDSNVIELEDRHGEHTLAPEIQIQRLTAQLTAAYNRIAVLEEQLLAQRVH